MKDKLLSILKKLEGEEDKLGYEKDDLISGINHGISIIDGSHEKGNIINRDKK